MRPQGISESQYTICTTPPFRASKKNSVPPASIPPAPVPSAPVPPASMPPASAASVPPASVPPAPVPPRPRARAPLSSSRASKKCIGQLKYSETHTRSYWTSMSLKDIKKTRAYMCIKDPPNKGSLPKSKLLDILADQHKQYTDVNYAENFDDILIQDNIPSYIDEPEGIVDYVYPHAWDAMYQRMSETRTKVVDNVLSRGFFNKQQSDIAQIVKFRSETRACTLIEFQVMLETFIQEVSEKMVIDENRDTNIQTVLRNNFESFYYGMLEMKSGECHVPVDDINAYLMVISQKVYG